MKNSQNYKNYKQLLPEDFKNLVAVAEKDGEVVSITMGGVATDKKYAEILRVVSENLSLFLDLPNHMIEEPSFLYAMFDIMEARLKELLVEENKSLDAIKFLSTYVEEVNKFIKSRAKLLNKNLPTFEFNVAGEIGKVPQPAQE